MTDFYLNIEIDLPLFSKGDEENRSRPDLSSQQRLLHPWSFPGRCPMGLRQARTDRVPTEGAVHGHADYLVETDSEPRETQQGHLRLSSLQNVDPSWCVKIS